MQSTWRSAPSARSRSPTARAVLPPMPGVDLVEDQRPGAVGRRAERRSARASPARARRPRRRRAAATAGDARGWSRAAARPSRRRWGRSRRDAAPARPRGSRPPSPARRARRRPARRAARPPLRRAGVSFAGELARARARPRPSRASSSAARSSALSSRSISARQRSACASTDSTLPPCLRSSRSSASSRSSTASSRPGRPRCRRGRRAARPRRRRARRPSAPTRSRERVERGVDARRPRQRGARPRASAAARRRRRPPRRRRSPPGRRRPRPRAAPRRGAGARARRRARRSSPGSGADRLDLGELVAVEVEVALARALALAQLGQLALQPPAPRDAPRGSRARQLEVLGAGEAVEDLQLGRGDRQLAVLVLAVEGEQPRRRAASGRPPRPARPADEGAGAPRAPTRRPSTTSSAPSGSRSASSASSGSSSSPSGRSKTPSTQASSAPGPDDLRPRPAAHQQVERVGEDGLPGPGLAGDRVQPRPSRSSARSISSRFSIRSSRSTPPVLAARGRRIRPRRGGYAAAGSGSAASARLRRSRAGARGRSRATPPTNETTAPIRRISLKPLTKATSAAWRLLAGPAAARLRRRPARAARGDDFGEARRGAAAAARRACESTRDWKIAPSAATPVAIPTWRKVVLIPEAIPALSPAGTTAIAAWRDRRVGDADADAGDEEAGQQRRPARRPALDAVHQQQADPDQRQARRRAAPGSGRGSRARRRSARR